MSSPTDTSDTVYIGSGDGNVYALDAKSGALRKHATAWTFRTDGALRNAAAYTQKNGDPDYGRAFSDDFYDDLIVGVWRMMSVGTVLASPAISGGAAYFGSTDGNIYAIS